MSIGFRILQRTRKVAPEMVNNFKSIPVANISDCMSRMSAGGHRLRPYHKGGALCGPALTVKTRPGDNLMIHKAIDIAEPGDVIVVDGGGDLINALIGELMLNLAAHNKIAGFVIDGAVRDSGFIAGMDLPVYAAGITHRGPYKEGPGEINVPIAIDGMVVAPGDLIVGDEDGVLSVPFDSAPSVFADAKAKNDAEAVQIKEMSTGTADRTWVDETLRAKGCAM